jgi:hypothetical protein
MQVFMVSDTQGFDRQALKGLLKSTEEILWFAKLFELDAVQLGELVRLCMPGSTVVDVLTEGTHSTELQDYLVEIGYEPEIQSGEIDLQEDAPKGEILPQMWESMAVEGASSIKDVANKLVKAMDRMPSKRGRMVLQTLRAVNRTRPTIGVQRAGIEHAPHAPNLVVLDVSGSMSEDTVATIVGDVVALSYMADAHLVVVSDSATHWEPGAYSTKAVLEASEFGGTHYEELAPLMDRDWGVVVTIADYDSSWSAKEKIATRKGRISMLLDISLVSRKTFLAECLGQLADETKQLLVAKNDWACLE